MKTTLNLRLVLLCKMMLIIFMAKMNAKDQDTFALKNRDTTLCAGVSLKLEATLNDSTDAKSWKNYRIEWTHNKTTLLSKTNSYTLKNVSPKDAGGYYFEVKALNSDTVIFKGSIKVKITELPAIPAIKHIIDNNTILLFCLGDEKKFNFSWTSPNFETYEGKTVTIEDAKIQELGNYQLKITYKDDANKCSSDTIHRISTDPDRVTSSSFPSLDQEQFEDGEPRTQMRQLNYETVIYECDINGKRVSDKSILSPRVAKFVEIGSNAEYYIIRFKSWSPLYINIKIPQGDTIITKKIRKLNSYRYRFNFTDTTETQFRFFLIKKADYFDRTVPYYSNKCIFTAGTTIIPVKARPFKNFEFTPDVALGPFIGAKKRISHFEPNFISLGLTTGISIATLTPLNSSVDSVVNLPALSMSLGAVGEFGRAQFGIFIGMDFINGNKNKDGTARLKWNQQGVPWFSIGFGYSILNRSHFNAGDDDSENDKKEDNKKDNKEDNNKDNKKDKPNK